MIYGGEKVIRPESVTPDSRKLGSVRTGQADGDEITMARKLR